MGHFVYLCRVNLNIRYMKTLIQGQAEEQCRQLRLKRNSKVQEADRIYRKTLDTLFETFTEEVKRLDAEIIRLKKEIAQEHCKMNEAWESHWNLHKDDDEKPVMGVVINPFKMRISELQVIMEQHINDRKHTRELYSHNRRIASNIKESANRDAEEEYLNERAVIMAQVYRKNEIQEPLKEAV